MPISSDSLKAFFPDPDFRKYVLELQSFFSQLADSLEQVYEDAAFRKSNSVAEMMDWEKTAIFTNRKQYPKLDMPSGETMMTALSAWRNRHIEPNLAKLLCRHSETSRPLVYQVGVRHLPPLFRALRLRARKSGADPSKILSVMTGHAKHANLGGPFGTIDRILELEKALETLDSDRKQRVQKQIQELELSLPTE